MKTSLLLIVGICIISSQGRLTQKLFTQAPKLRTVSKPPIRLVRQIFDDDSLTGFSREEDGQSDEFVQSYNRRSRYFYKHKPQPPASMARLPRGSDNTLSNATEINANSSHEKTVLIKKPIPKYNEADYEEDFEIRISKAGKIIADSGEHEDEDFNLDDYDFDVNHDEFAGRGKPLEPRTKFKEIKERNTEFSMQPSEIDIPKPNPEIKVQSKVNVPPPRTSTPNKNEPVKSKNGNKVAEKIKDDDYYEDIVSKDTAKQKIRAANDEFADDNEESKEFDQKRPFIRTARSPWNLNSYADKIGEKSSTLMSKLLGILPMFPQIPVNRMILSSLSK